MIYNLHTHTARCHHAVGETEEYIKCAIEAGIKHLGFSDHAPMVFDDGYQSRWRVFAEEAEDYVSELRSLREKYKDQIEISIGFEMEYYPAHFSKMLGNARKVGAEYLILGQHFVKNEHPNGIGSIGPTEDPGMLKTYVDEVIEGMKTGVYTYVAHPDLTCFIGDKAVYEREIERLCLAAKESNTPLEINLLGIRNHKHYPNDKFWEIVGRIGAPVTIGVDAHDSKDFLDPDQHNAAAEIIKRHKLNYVGMAKLRWI